ncbi:hypothetical protein [Thermococcus sp.]
MLVAVRIYLPLSLGVPIFIDGLTRYFVSRARGTKAGEKPTDAGEAIMGIFFAALVVTNKAPAPRWNHPLALHTWKEFE